ncbi:MAG: sensor histidine kinase, partial [Roseimicrobium sp.]
MRFPIPAKLLVGFLANLVLLALGFLAVFRAQFGGAWSEIFSGIAEPRVQALAVQLSAELRSQNPSRWSQLLQTHAKALGVDITLLDGDLEPFAGPSITVPPLIYEKVAASLTPHRRAPSGREPPPRPEPLPFDDLFGFPGDPPPDGRPPPHPRPHELHERPTMDPDLATYPKVMALSTSPTAYWVITRVPAMSSPRGWLPMMLVIRSESLTGNGCFFDPMPWIYAGAGVVLLSALIWVPIATGLTRSLWRIHKATGRIAEGDFAVSVPDADRRDELGDLGRSVQLMAQRLEGYVTGQKRFLGDIAHELCSPIARMQTALGIIEQSGEDDAKRQRYYEKVHRELQHMGALVNELLSFSKASLKREVALQPVALAPLVREEVRREAEGTALVHIHVPPETTVEADPELLRRAVGNLIR